MSDDQKSHVTRTQAQVRRGWWPGWIWTIPVAAVLLVGWWAIRTFLAGGVDITISFDDVHGLKGGSDTKVVYRGMQIGQVREVKLAKDGKSVTVSAEIQDDAAQFLRSGTQFWLRGATPDLSDPSSLSAVISGPTLVMQPGPGNKERHFAGLVRRPVISGAHGAPDVYALSLAGDVGGLGPGEPVKLRGFTVGEVKDVGFRYDPQSGQIRTPVTIALYPELLHIDGGGDALKTAVHDLIRNGLRARLDRNPPLVGTPQITLDVMQGASGPTPADIDGVPQIPVASQGGLDSIVQRVNKVPVDQIAQNVLDITHHIDAVVSSAALNDAIAQLDGALQQIRRTADSTGPQVTHLVDQLRQTADRIDRAATAAEGTAKSAQQTAAAADKMLGGTPNQHGMQNAMREITEAARSVRDLANYLDQHPEALVKGKQGD